MKRIISLHLLFIMSTVAAFCSSPTGQHANGAWCSFATRYVCLDGQDVEVEHCTHGCVAGTCLEYRNTPQPWPASQESWGIFYLLGGCAAVLVVLVILLVLACCTAGEQFQDDKTHTLA